MRGPQNGDSTGDFFRGSSLNLEWSKRGIWLDNQWMLISWLHIEDFVVFSFLCFIAMTVEYIDMLIVLIDHFVLLSALILILAWLFWSLHMHTLTIVYHSALIVAFSLILCVHEWYILLCLTIWSMTALPLHDCMLLVYVGLTSIPLLPNLLVSVIPFISVLTITSVRPSECFLSDRARD